MIATKQARVSPALALARAQQDSDQQLQQQKPKQQQQADCDGASEQAASETKSETTTRATSATNTATTHQQLHHHHQPQQQQQHHHQSFATASSKIQARQQKFLAAAAKSATSPSACCTPASFAWRAPQATTHTKRPVVDSCESGANGVVVVVGDSQHCALLPTRQPNPMKAAHNQSGAEKSLPVDNGADHHRSPSPKTSICLNDADINCHSAEQTQQQQQQLKQKQQQQQEQQQQQQQLKQSADHICANQHAIESTRRNSSSLQINANHIIERNDNHNDHQPVLQNKEDVRQTVPKATTPNEDHKQIVVVARKGNHTNDHNSEQPITTLKTSSAQHTSDKQVANNTATTSSVSKRQTNDTPIVGSLTQTSRQSQLSHNSNNNINNNNPQVHNNQITYHNNNHHHHHHHHHHQQQQHHSSINHIHSHHQHQQQQQPNNNAMAHYKFHNDCQSSVLTYEQVKRLDFVMDQTVPIHGRGNSPTLYVKLKELIRLVKYKLQKEHSIEIRDVRLNGGAASYVLAPENSHYNDLDLIFGTDLSDENRFDVIRDVVLECLREFFPKNNNQQPSQQLQQQQQQHSQQQYHNYNQMPLNNCAIKEAYVHKMVKVNDDDRWSLISLGVQQSEANCCSQSTVNDGSVNGKPEQQLSNLNGDISNKTAEQQQPAITFSIGQQQNQQRNNCQKGQQQQQQQFPNSIELKFVDRMRRKFEFSVDSFQIILDSLIQFYDYAPQSTITSQIKLSSSNPSATMINTRPMRRCSGLCLDNSAGQASFAAELQYSTKDENGCGQSTNTINGLMEQKHKLHGGYYRNPLEPVNSPPISSVASSSGCSSSSSVVSSSSSSLSCDEDNEDLYCDADCPSSSSASTSSLLSSTTISLLSSDGQHNAVGSASGQENCDQQQKLKCQQATTTGEQNMKNDTRGGDVCKNHHLANFSARQQSNKQAASEANTNSSRIAFNDCVDYFEQQGQFNHNQNHSYQQTHNHNHQNQNHHHHHHQQYQVNSSLCDFELSKTSCAVISENFYPTVIGRSEYGNFKEALYHLEKKLIATRSPEEIRGGGLLKYCNLLVKNYKPTNVYQIRTLERYMCSRFFIDFSDLNQQQAKLESYLANHFSDDLKLKFDYLTILHNVVQRSTVCLMNHELRLTLNMIRDLAYKLNEQQKQQQQQQQQSQVQNQVANPPNQQRQQQNISPQPSHIQVQQSAQQRKQQQQYCQQKPVVIQSAIYRVKLVNYTLANPVKS